jgi:prepilin-type N-terminal cleavage/methylation domain-containing protein
MKLVKNIKQEKGYTLIETIVAMALFLSFLIPLVTIMGNTMLDRKVNLTNKALALAITEMNMTADSREFTDSQKITGDGLVVQRNVQKSIPLFEVEVVVKTSGGQPKEIISLKRVFLVYQ